MSDGQEADEIIGRIYDVAVDPNRFEKMLDVWEKRLSPRRLQAGGSERVAADPGIEAHIERADIFLERFTHDAIDPGESLLATENKAAIAVDASLTVVAANRIAVQALGVSARDRLSSLPLDQSDLSLLQTSIRRMIAQKGATPMLLRFTSQTTERSIVFHIAPHVTPAGAPQVLIRTTELGWPPHLAQALHDAFGLTSAECEIVRSLVEGRSPKQIAEERQRSFATVRTQISAILSKTETRSQTELVRLTLGLMDVVRVTAEAENAPVSEGVVPLPLRSFSRAGRRLDFIEFGAPSGWPCLYLSFAYGMNRWPRSAENAAAARGIRVIAPIRAGYGFSSPHPPKVDYALDTARDMLALLDHAGLRRCAILTLGADLRYALRLAMLAPERVAGIMACSAALPVTTAAQYERMGKWHRFILANARYAPQILPFITKAGFAFARQVGKERFLRTVNAGSAADLRTFAIPEVRDAILAGTDVCLGKQHSAHNAFSREILDGEVDWSWLVRECPVPLKLLQGAQDPQMPGDTVREQAQAFPDLEIEIFEDAGQLLFFQEWPRVLAALETLYTRRRG